MKPTRFYDTTLNIIPAPVEQTAKLLPSLQNETVMTPMGGDLRLLCVPTFAITTITSGIKWTFKPRSPTSTTSVLEFTGNELKLLHVTEKEHDGVYNCSYAGDQQVRQIHNIACEQNILIKSLR